MAGEYNSNIPWFSILTGGAYGAAIGSGLAKYYTEDKDNLLRNTLLGGATGGALGLGGGYLLGNKYRMDEALAAPYVLGTPEEVRIRGAMLGSIMGAAGGSIGGPAFMVPGAVAGGLIGGTSSGLFKKVGGYLKMKSKVRHIQNPNDKVSAYKVYYEDKLAATAEEAKAKILSSNQHDVAMRYDPTAILKALKGFGNPDPRYYARYSDLGSYIRVPENEAYFKYRDAIGDLRNRARGLGVNLWTGYGSDPASTLATRIRKATGTEWTPESGRAAMELASRPIEEQINPTQEPTGISGKGAGAIGPNNLRQRAEAVQPKAKREWSPPNVGVLPNEVQDSSYEYKGEDVYLNDFQFLSPGTDFGEEYSSVGTPIAQANGVVWVKGPDGKIIAMSEEEGPNGDVSLIKKVVDSSYEDFIKRVKTTVGRIHKDVPSNTGDKKSMFGIMPWYMSGIPIPGIEDYAAYDLAMNGYDFNKPLFGNFFGLGQPEVCPETGCEPTGRGIEGEKEREHKVLRKRAEAVQPKDKRDKKEDEDKKKKKKKVDDKKSMSANQPPVKFTPGMSYREYRNQVGVRDKAAAEDNKFLLGAATGLGSTAAVGTAYRPLNSKMNEFLVKAMEEIPDSESLGYTFYKALKNRDPGINRIVKEVAPRFKGLDYLSVRMPLRGFLSPEIIAETYIGGIHKNYPIIALNQRAKSYPSITAHELGHAVNQFDETLKHLLLKRHLSKAAPIVALVGTGLGLGLSEDPKVRNSVLAGTSLATLGLGAPLLAEEYKATRTGMKVLRKAYPTITSKVARGPMGYGWGTYAAPIALAAALPWAALGGKKLIDKSVDYFKDRR